MSYAPLFDRRCGCARVSVPHKHVHDGIEIIYYIIQYSLVSARIYLLAGHRDTCKLTSSAFRRETERSASPVHVLVPPFAIK